MAKFINKKEQVFDLKLTSYGHYLLSIGDFKPTYYAFYDDNVIYDGAYTGNAEAQSSIDNRIKNETQYLEGLTLFEDVEEIVSKNKGSVVNFFDLDITPTKTSPRRDNFNFDSAIGDAYHTGDPQTSPAWKIATLAGEISSSQTSDSAGALSNNIPQINIELKYVKETVMLEDTTLPSNVRELSDTTGVFIDDKVIRLRMDDLLIHADEINTELLTENFDVEVFEVVNSSPDIVDALERKYFEYQKPQIRNGYMISAVPTLNNVTELPTTSVEYYFDIVRDRDVNAKVACKAATQFNKSAYYIDIDFDCEEEEKDGVVFDIYGQVTEPEICQD